MGVQVKSSILFRLGRPLAIGYYTRHPVEFILSDVTALPLTFGLFVAHGNKGGVVIVSVWVSPHVSKQVEEEKEFLISGHVHWVCQVGVQFWFYIVGKTYGCDKWQWVCSVGVTNGNGCVQWV